MENCRSRDCFPSYKPPFMRDFPFPLLMTGGYTIIILWNIILIHTISQSTFKAHLHGDLQRFDEFPSHADGASSGESLWYAFASERQTVVKKTTSKTEWSPKKCLRNVWKMGWLTEPQKIQTSKQVSIRAAVTKVKLLWNGQRWYDGHLILTPP